MDVSFYKESLCLGIAACLGDLIVPFFLGPKKRNYSHFYDTISDLGTKESPTFKQTSIWLFGFGVAFIFFAIGLLLKIGISPIIHLVFGLSMMSFGIGAGIISGIFPEDPKGEPETIHGKIHGIAAGLGSIGLLLSIVLAYWIENLPINKWFASLFFILALFSFILFLGTKNKMKGSGVLAMAGLWQRVFLIICYLFFVTNAILLA